MDDDTTFRSAVDCDTLTPVQQTSDTSPDSRHLAFDRRTESDVQKGPDADA
jgi:hypothetical protein